MAGYAPQGEDGPGKLALALIALEKGHYPFKNYRHAHAKSVFFPGCNFPSLYPKTCAALAQLLQEHCDMGIAYDCCGKPLRMMGREDRFQQIAQRISARLDACGAEEIVCACPNCFYALRGVIPQRVTSVYAKLVELGITAALPCDQSQPVMFPACPDRREALLLQDAMELVDGHARVPMCAGVSHAQAALGKKTAPSCKREGSCEGCAVLPCCRHDCSSVIAKDEQIVTYCASCVGYLIGAGYFHVEHVLCAALGTHEQPDMAKSFINRARTKFA